MPVNQEIQAAFLALALSLAACEPASLPSPTPISAVLPTPSFGAPTSFALRPTLLSTAAVASPVTASVVATPTPMPPPTSSVAAGGSPALVTPPTPIPADKVGTAYTQTLVSPDGRWMATYTFDQPPNSGYHLLFKVARVDGTTSWTLLDGHGEGLGYSYPVLKQWSRDSRRFYFAGSFAADGACALFQQSGHWQRLDVVTGRVVELPWPAGREHVLAVDEDRIAYIAADEPLRLVIHDIASGTERSVKLVPPTTTAGQPAAGNIAWSPDGGALVVVLTSGDSCTGTAVFSLLRVESATLQTTKLISSVQQLPMVVAWSPSDKILLRDRNGYSWWIDPMTGQPTTAPAP